jgi:hypothetical protein
MLNPDCLLLPTLLQTFLDLKVHLNEIQISAVVQSINHELEDYKQILKQQNRNFDTRLKYKVYVHYLTTFKDKI